MRLQESQKLDLVFAALANPVRRSILDTIAKGERTVVELAEPHAMSLNAVSKHIKYLERAGLVRRCVDGSYHRISIDQAALVGAAKWLSHYVPFWGDALRNLKTYVESA
jgi:DNA-binding transcriptional ArsR family regulator